MGWTQLFGGLFAFFVVANDFGFSPSNFVFKGTTMIMVPAESDQYNPSTWNFGNSKLAATSCSNSK